MVEQTRRVVQSVAVQMAHADNDLERMPERVLGED